ncbi:hypothetical protein LG331_16170 [Vreelandella aquamarina]|uniref:hypothetical protein n=1 Tax=Vreelandella aquamarina TaxID=77097 RepID=UPI00384C7070
MALNADEIYNMHPNNRRSVILENAGLCSGDSFPDDITKISNCINSFIDDYFDICINADSTRPNGSILSPHNIERAFMEEVKKFKPQAKSEMAAMVRRFSNKVESPVNIYELSGAYTMASANKLTRTLSTTLGLLWERLADISPYGINPEKEFNLKIKGIDAIVKNKNTGNIEHCQIKTQKNTLTGSQTGRSVSELQVHNNPVFCACFDLGSWTFNHPHIPRVAGSDFWNRIGIDYDMVVNVLSTLLSELEDEYRGMV